MALSEEIISSKAQQAFDIIEWFEQICLDNAFNDIELLTRNYGLLSALSVSQARKMRVVAKEYRSAHAERRIRCALREVELQETTDPFTTKPYTATKAQAIALKENQDVYRKEYTNQGEWEGGELVMRSIDKTLFAMFKMITELSGTRSSEAKTQADNYPS